MSIIFVLSNKMLFMLLASRLMGLNYTTLDLADRELVSSSKLSMIAIICPGILPQTLVFCKPKPPDTPQTGLITH